MILHSTDNGRVGKVPLRSNGFTMFVEPNWLLVPKSAVSALKLGEAV